MKLERHRRDLRQELIEAGLDILAEDGLEKLTLRRVAARTGVSHAAPAHHFNGLPHLLGCICAVGFQNLTAAMRERRAMASPSARAQLIAICDAYLDFAIANPGQMQLMFNANPGAVDVDEVRPVLAVIYRELRDACAPFEPVGEAPDSTETMIWSLIHGLAFLRIGGRFSTSSRATNAPDFGDILPNLPLRR